LSLLRRKALDATLKLLGLDPQQGLGTTAILAKLGPHPSVTADNAQLGAERVQRSSTTACAAPSEKIGHKKARRSAPRFKFLID
jgi:hypothetical protein